MSLATLKKKTAAKYNNMSVGSKDGFSLNGTRRSQGYIGQDTLGRTLLKTPMKGNVVKGSGGCCGTYKVSPVVQSAVTSLNDINVIKSTVGSSSTFLLDHSHAGYPENIVNNDSNLNLNTQQDYIERTRKTAITNADNSDCGPSEAVVDDFTVNSNGLYFVLYNFYFADNTAIFDGSTNYYTGLNGAYNGYSSNFTDLSGATNGNMIAGNTQTVKSAQFLGYFLVPDSQSGTWTFQLQSDDSSLLWLGANAISGYTIPNALVDCSGLHGVNDGSSPASNSISLVANTYYPIRIQFGNNLGAYNLTLTITSPRGVSYTDMTGFFFNQNGTLSSGHVYTAPKTTCSTKNYNYQQLAKARNMNLCKNVKDLTKLTSSSLSNQPSGIATSYDLYMRKINDKCVSNDVYKFTRNIGGTPLPDNK